MLTIMAKTIDKYSRGCFERIYPHINEQMMKKLHRVACRPVSMSPVCREFWNRLARNRAKFAYAMPKSAPSRAADVATI